jgi:hypothetical protein
MNFGNKILLKILDKVNIPMIDYLKSFNTLKSKKFYEFKIIKKNDIYKLKKVKKCIFHKYNILDSHLSDCGYFIVEYKCKKCGKIKRKLRF